MSLFRYKLLTESGKVRSGVVDLPLSDPAAALRYLEYDGDIALELQPLPKILDAFVQTTSIGLGSLSRLELAEFYTNLGMLVGAGVTILDGLEEILEDTKNPRLKNAIQCMCADIQTGQTFSESLSKHRHMAPFTIQHMVIIGEETGRLEQMLKKCGDHLLHLHEIVSATKRALTYPAFLLVVVLLAIIFWFWYVVPQLVELFQYMNIELPLPTRILIAISDWFQNWFGVTVIGVIVLGIIVAILHRKVYKVRYAMSYLALHTPVLSTVMHASLVARATEYLGIMLGAGIGVLRSLQMITEGTDNEVYKERLLNTQQSIKAGSLLSASLRRHQALDPFAIRMLAVGEMTGRIDDQAAYVAQIYRDKLSGLVQLLSKTLEPVIMLVIGGLFALIMIGLLLPVYDLISQIGG